jgi:hypothetical protein
MCGFGRKGFAKKLLVKKFTQNEDYKILLPGTEVLLQLEKQDVRHRGSNKEQILSLIHI